MKHFIIFTLFISIIFAQQINKGKAKETANDEIDHSFENEDILEFQSPDLTTEQQLGWINSKYF